MSWFSKGQYQYPPGTRAGDAETRFTHVAIPRDAAQAEEWAQEAGHPVAGRVDWPNGIEPLFYTPAELAAFVAEKAQWDRADRRNYRDPWPGDDWKGEAGL